MQQKGRILMRLKEYHYKNLMSYHCPICNSNQIKQKLILSRDNQTLPVGKCGMCKHRFLLTEYENIYSSGKFSLIARNNQAQPDNEKVKKLETKAFDRMEFYKEFIGKNDNVLEIGSSAGSFVHFLKLIGRDADGLEPDPFYSEYSRVLYNFDQYTATLEDFVNKKKYDAVCSFHVIEHVENPIVFVKKIFDLLNPEGRLLIECPSMEIHSFGHLKKTIWKPHLHYFSAPSFYRLLSPFFKIEKIGYYQSSIYVIAQKNDRSRFLIIRYSLLKFRSFCIYLMNRIIPDPFTLFSFRQLLVQSLFQKDKFASLSKRSINYTRYKFKEKAFLKNEYGNLIIPRYKFQRLGK
jgi:SAM-dependent methyltransferase